MLREDERQGCCVWVSFPALFPSWLAPLNSPVVWFAGILMGLGGHEYIGSWDFSNFRVLIWLCSHCVTLVSLCIPLPLSMTSVLLYLCYHSHDAPVGAEMPCRVWTQWQEASLVFLKGLLPFTPSLGVLCDFQCACLLAKSPGPNVLLPDTLRTPFLVSWADWHWISFERKQTIGFLIFFSFL